MVGNMTRLYDADAPEKHRDFTFDYSFWSHDQFIVDEAGYFVYAVGHSAPKPTSTRTRDSSLNRSASRS
jgi:hypothetical protein